MVGSLQLANLHRKQCKKIQSEFTRGKDFFKQVMVGCLAIIDQQGFAVKSENDMARSQTRASYYLRYQNFPHSS